ncbi:DUF4129 domain-containing protein [Bacillus sp. BHET2]|uniref:DUF4129 domain-containing protein n=1 Tax=Bacillus sp. BHET2 TaxID=2583818 RepID=UPI001F10B0F9|nr:DUF4129 domain-containing protein [Bacillus sp. BHET2]
MDERRAKDQIKDILEGEEYKAYQDESQGLLAGWWQRAQEWLAEQLQKINPSFGPTDAAASGILITLIVIVLAVLLVIVFFMVRTRVRIRKFRSNKPLQSLNEMEWSYSSHLEEAYKQEALHDYSKATRHMFLALLLYFHEREYLEARVWKTNWEYYDELQRVNQGWADRFYKLALLFDEVAYGERDVNESEYLQYKHQAEEWLGNGEDPSLDRLREGR